VEDITQPVEDSFVLNLSTVRSDPFEAYTWTVPQLAEYFQRIITTDFLIFPLLEQLSETHSNTV
jgi:hypothetical protein